MAEEIKEVAVSFIYIPTATEIYLMCHRYKFITQTEAKQRKQGPQRTNLEMSMLVLNAKKKIT